MYRYEDMKPELFTEDGMTMFVAIRDRAHALLKEAGAFTMGSVIRAAKSGDSWLMLACVDRLVETGEVQEITPPNGAMGQNRVFVFGAAP